MWRPFAAPRLRDSGGWGGFPSAEALGLDMSALRAYLWVAVLE